MWNTNHEKSQVGQIAHPPLLPRLLKRWLLGTHAGAVRPKHLQAYLDEFAFRHNRRKTNGVGRIAARVIEQLVAHGPLPMRKIIDESTRCRWFMSAQHAMST
jgi:hypothetical protein